MTLKDNQLQHSNVYNIMPGILTIKNDIRLLWTHIPNGKLCGWTIFKPMAWRNCKVLGNRDWCTHLWEQRFMALGISTMLEHIWVLRTKDSISSVLEETLIFIILFLMFLIQSDKFTSNKTSFKNHHL